MKKILKICIILSFTFLLTGCVDCLVSLNYSKIKKPTLYGELTIEPQILEKYSMSISQIKKQLLDHDFFKDWTIKKQTDSSLSIESPTSFIKEISTLTKQNNKYILSIDIPKNMLDTSELNHYKNTLQLLNSSMIVHGIFSISAIKRIACKISVLSPILPQQGMAVGHQIMTALYFLQENHIGTQRPDRSFQFLDNGPMINRCPFVNIVSCNTKFHSDLINLHIDRYVALLISYRVSRRSYPFQSK